MLGEHDAIAISTSSAYAKELRRWEAHPTKYGPPGRPFTQQEHPKMLYQLEQVVGKGIQIKDRHLAMTEDEERNMNSRGFYAMEQAIEALKAQQTDHGRLAAEREWDIQHGRLSEKAIAEVRAAEVEHGAAHMPVMPETKIRKTRKAKVS